MILLCKLLLIVLVSLVAAVLLTVLQRYLEKKLWERAERLVSELMDKID